MVEFFFFFNRSLVIYFSPNTWIGFYNTSRKIKRIPLENTKREKKDNEFLAVACSAKNSYFVFGATKVWSFIVKFHAIKITKIYETTTNLFEAVLIRNKRCIFHSARLQSERIKTCFETRAWIVKLFTADGRVVKNYDIFNGKKVLMRVASVKF